MYRLKELAGFKNLVHGFSTLPDGNMSFRWGSENEVLANKDKFLAALGIRTDSCVQMQTLDDAVIREADPGDAGKSMEKEYALEADALVTNRRGLFLFLVVGDCLPAIFYDREKSVAALAHLGWKSTDRKLAPAVVKFMEERYGSDPAAIAVGFGPGIKKESYRFDDPLQKELNAGWEPFLDRSVAGSTAIDVLGYNERQLLNAGIRKENLFASAVDTIMSRDFFSHYRSRKTGEREGRFAAVVGMPPPMV